MTSLWGLSWRVADIDATRARLLAAGIDVSEVRNGRKPGTRVMTRAQRHLRHADAAAGAVAEAGGVRRSSLVIASAAKQSGSVSAR